MGIRTVRKKKINVMGHIGMLPQSTKGKYLIFGRKKREESQVLKDLILLEICSFMYFNFNILLISCLLGIFINQVIKFFE